MSVLLALASLHASPAQAADCAAADTVRAFAAAADARDAAALERILHPEFRVVFSVKGSSQASVISRSAWFAMFEQGKIGGTPRELTVGSATTEPGLAVVAATLVGASGRFESSFTVARGAAGCQIVQDAVVFTPPAPK